MKGEAMADGTRLAMIGAGQMGEAIISGVVAGKSFDPESITAAEPVEKKRLELAERFGIKTVADNAQAVAGADIVILAVKPQVLQAALAPVKGRIRADAVLLSIVAGATLETLERLSGHAKIVRAMPNTPARVGKGVTAWISSAAFSEDKAGLVQRLLASIGADIRLKDEEMLDMVTAVSGSGPAYVFLFIEAMIDSAVHIGLPRDIATELVARTVAGSAEMMERFGAHPAVLRNQVTSPGGTTAAGLFCLERGGMRDALSQAVWAAYERSRDLAQGAPGRKP
jgi:pyrroline-5-carboxylate reductase